MNFTGKFMTIGNKIADLMILNIVYIICCIPIFTIGAATTALYSITFKMTANTEPYIVKGFFKALKENLKQSTIIWLILLAAGSLIGLDLYFISLMPDGLSAFLKYFFIMAAIIGIMLALYIFPLTARFYNTTKMMFKNAFIMSIRHLPYTILVLIITGIPVILMLFNVQLFVSSIIIIVLIGFSLIAYINSFILKRVFARYMEKEEELS